MSLVSLCSRLIAPPLRCSAESYHPREYGLNSLRVPFDPLKAALVLNVGQFSVAALDPPNGPSPPLIGLNALPVPAGMAKQLVHMVPVLAGSPPGIVVAGAPSEIVPGMDEASGILFSSPHGLQSIVYLECSFP